VCNNFSSTKICSPSVHVKYFADRNPPVVPFSTRTARRQARRSASAGGISMLLLHRVDI